MADQMLLSMHPHFDTGIADYKAIHRDKGVVGKAVGGFILYFTVFMMIIPILIHRLDNEELLLSYLANVDLIATVLSFKNGPFGQDLFRYLYMDTRPLIGYLNNNIINLYVLITITYVISSSSVKNKSVSDGMSKAIITYVLTYLFPGRLISEIMHKTYDMLDRMMSNTGNKDIIYLITMCIGFIAAIGLIIIESFITKNYYKTFSGVLKRNFIWIF